MGLQGGTGLANLGQRLGQGLGALGQQYQGLAAAIACITATRYKSTSETWWIR